MRTGELFDGVVADKSIEGEAEFARLLGVARGDTSLLVDVNLDVGEICSTVELVLSTTSELDICRKLTVLVVGFPTKALLPP